MIKGNQKQQLPKTSVQIVCGAPTPQGIVLIIWPLAVQCQNCGGSSQQNPSVFQWKDTEATSGHQQVLYTESPCFTMILNCHFFMEMCCSSFNLLLHKYLLGFCVVTHSCVSLWFKIKEFRLKFGWWCYRGHI